jgi:hypothetical protein
MLQSSEAASKICGVAFGEDFPSKSAHNSEDLKLDRHFF